LHLLREVEEDADDDVNKEEERNKEVDCDMMMMMMMMMLILRELSFFFRFAFFSLDFCVKYIFFLFRCVVARDLPIPRRERGLERGFQFLSSESLAHRARFFSSARRVTPSQDFENSNFFFDLSLCSLFSSKKKKEKKRKRKNHTEEEEERALSRRARGVKAAVVNLFFHVFFCVCVCVCVCGCVCIIYI
jgi:uncharacterized membrane protein